MHPSGKTAQKNLRGKYNEFLRRMSFWNDRKNHFGGEERTPLAGIRDTKRSQVTIQTRSPNYFRCSPPPLNTSEHPQTPNDFSHFDGICKVLIYGDLCKLLKRPA
jgi:hypothetical protein